MDGFALRMLFCVWLGMMVPLASHGVSASKTGCHKKILARGSESHGVVGISFGPNGELWVARGLVNTIEQIHPLTGQVIQHFDQSDGLGALSSIAVRQSDGSVYWTEPLSGRVGRLLPNGQTTIVATVPGADALEFSNDGRLFVSSVVTADELWEIDPDGVQAPRLVASGTLGWLNEFAFGPDNMIYGPRSMERSIEKVDPDTGAITIVATGFIAPGAVDFDLQGRLYVADMGDGNVYRVNLNNNTKKKIAHIDGLIDTLDFSPEGALYYADVANGNLRAILPDHSKVKLNVRSGMSLPGGVAVITRPNGKDRVFVADFWAFREFRGKNGKQKDVHYFQNLPELMGPGIGIPQTVSVNSQGLLLLTSIMDGAVRVWDPDADEMVSIYPGFAAPVGAVEFGGDIAVAELGTGQVVRASDRSVIASGLAVPAGLASRGGDLYLTDNVTGTVWKIGELGMPLATPVAVATGLVFPEGIAIQANGKLLVVEVGQMRLVEIDPVTQAITPLVGNLAVGVPAPFGLPPSGLSLTGVSVSDHGNIYVTGDVHDLLYKITCH